MAMRNHSANSSQESLCSSSTAPSIHDVTDKLAPAVTGSMVWANSGLKPSEYVLHLSDSELLSVQKGVIGFRLTGLGPEAIDKSTFHLPAELADKLSAVSKEIHSGLGVAVIRGLENANFNYMEGPIAFAGICSYVAPSRATDSYANITMSHVRDATHDAVPDYAKDIGLAGSKITSALEFHSDRFSGDILALHVRNDGGVGDGGEQFVVSFWKIYNDLLENEPAVLETMAAPNWPFELKQKDKAPYLELGPTLFFSKGKPICQLVKAPLLGSPRIARDPSMPALSDEQLHALHVVEQYARKHATKLDRQTGDIQFIHNLSIMHARSAYGLKGQSKREILRMFLRDPENAWEKPSAYQDKFDNPFASGRPQHIPFKDLDPWRAISGMESHG